MVRPLTDHGCAAWFTILRCASPDAPKIRYTF
jgi:hypothetical protein